MVKIEIDRERCIGCGACVNVCPVSLYELIDEKSKVTGNVDTCILCRACETSCPVGCIKITE
ncbi:MAG: 4Fe-4S dicluster domain-containing protein [Candidatus Altiarchaeota archaeon]|nr:4Fe-4S dicluster domain-containing protein [Candidatus Altiarchaeota archaeon]